MPTAVYIWFAMMPVIIYLLRIDKGRDTSKKVRRHPSNNVGTSKLNFQIQPLEEQFKENTTLNEKHCKKCNSENNIHQHHIIPIQFGGTDDKENLEYLCRDCHEKEHNYTFGEEFTELEGRSPKEKYQIIYDAIINNQKLEIIYFSPSFWDKKAKTTKRIIMPKKLYKATYNMKNGKSGFHMAVKAHCFLRGEERTFQARRIKKLLVLKE